MKRLGLKRPVIAVAGSSGKTTTKEMLASILQKRWKVFKSKANKNDRADMFKNVKQIRPDHKALVLEYGMSRRGNLRRSCQILRPNIGIITMVGTAHIGNFGGTIGGLIRAKSELILYMKQNGMLFINADDSNSKRLITAKFRGKIVTVGIKNKAFYKAADVKYTKNGMSFRIKLDNSYHDIYIPIYGIHNVYNALFAIAVAHSLGFSAHEIKAGLRTYKKPGRRLTVYHLKRNVRLIDDTFNANPNSVKAAVDVLSSIGKAVNIAVLGNMSELGRYSQSGHRAVGKHVAKKKLTYLVTYGSKARKIGVEAIAQGFRSGRVIHAENRRLLHKRLKGIISPASTILVKGSHNMRMGTTVKFLRKNV